MGRMQTNAPPHTAARPFGAQGLSEKRKAWKMKGFLEGVAVILLATVILAAIPTEAEGKIYEDTVRLHILAHSDSEEDQAVKICVRDYLLSAYGDLFSGYGSAEEAAAAMEAILPQIEADACRILEEAGFSYGAHVTLSEEWYERREYADSVYPEGRYTSLRVILGDGDGKNWWCVMYPPLCLDMALGETLPYSEEERALIGGKYQWKLKSLEMAAKIWK